MRSLQSFSEQELRQQLRQLANEVGNEWNAQGSAQYQEILHELNRRSDVNDVQYGEQF